MLVIGGVRLVGLCEKPQGADVAGNVKIQDLTPHSTRIKPDR